MFSSEQTQQSTGSYLISSIEKAVPQSAGTYDLVSYLLPRDTKVLRH